MDICYPPTTYKYHYLVIKKFSSIKTDSHLGTLLAASIKHPTKLSWVSGLRKILKIYDMNIKTVMTPIPQPRHMMRPYWWSFLRAYINARPYLAHLTSELPAAELGLQENSLALGARPQAGCVHPTVGEKRPGGP
jgi:hypothetical protein